MTLPLNRRDFLKRNAAAGLILGLPLLEGCYPTGKEEPRPRAASGLSAVADELLTEARQRMKKETKPGVVLVIPAKPDAAKALAADLSRLLGISGSACAAPPVAPANGKAAGPARIDPAGAACPPGMDAFLRRLFTRAVFVCLPADDVRTLYPAVRSDGAAVLLDVSGKPIDQLASRPELFSKDFTAAMTKFLSGPKGEHAAAVRDAQRAALGTAKAAQVDQDLRDLDSDRFAAREMASRQLRETAATTTTLLATALDDAKSPESRKRLEAIFEELYLGVPAGTAGVRLPYGVEIDQPKFDPCPACGMAFIANEGLVFIRFTAVPGGKK
jgi:hypothetical protein